MGWGQRDGWRVMHTNASEYNGFAGRLDLRCENGPQKVTVFKEKLWTILHFFFCAVASMLIVRVHWPHAAYQLAHAIHGPAANAGFRR